MPSVLAPHTADGGADVDALMAVLLRVTVLCCLASDDAKEEGRHQAASAVNWVLGLVELSGLSDICRYSTCTWQIDRPDSYSSRNQLYIV